MSLVAPAALLGAAVAVLVGLPTPSRLGGLVRSGTVPRAGPGPWPALAGGIGAVGGPLLLGPAGLLAGPAVVLVAVRALRRRRARERRSQERRQAVEGCAVLAGELRAGRTPAEALAAAAAVAVGAVAAALENAAGCARLGGDVPAALSGPAAGSAAPDLLRGLAACWQVCGSVGSGLAPSVERLEQALRQEQVQRNLVDAELAGPRATAALLALLPLAGLGLAAALGARPLHVLLHTPAGLVCGLAGVGLDALGLWWTRKLVRAVGGQR